MIRPGEGVRIDDTGVYPLPGSTTVTRDEVLELRAQVTALRQLVAVLLAALWLARAER